MCSIVRDGSNYSVTPPYILRLVLPSARPGVLITDFWTTRCTNCPAALDSLDTMAEQRPSVRFISVNIDDADAAKALLEKAASEGRWTR